MTMPAAAKEPVVPWTSSTVESGWAAIASLPMTTPARGWATPGAPSTRLYASGTMRTQVKLAPDGRATPGERDLRARARGCGPRGGAPLLPRRARLRGDALRRGGRGPLLVPGRRHGSAGAVDRAGRARRGPRRHSRPLRLQRPGRPDRRAEAADRGRRGRGRGPDSARPRPRHLRHGPGRERGRVLEPGHGGVRAGRSGRRPAGNLQARAARLAVEQTSRPAQRRPGQVDAARDARSPSILPPALHARPPNAPAAGRRDRRDVPGPGRGTVARAGLGSLLGHLGCPEDADGDRDGGRGRAV